MRDNSLHPHLIRCPICEAVNVDTGEKVVCRRCTSRIPHPRESYFRSWALLLTAMILWVPANLFPILRIETIFGHVDNTVIGGVITLWDEGSWMIALVILIASVIVPILKFIVLLYLLISSRYPVRHRRHIRHRLYTLIELIGAWSMVDIFVVTALSGMVTFDSFQIVAGAGATAYVLMVFFTLASALVFDPRLITQYHRKNNAIRQKFDRKGKHGIR